MSRLDDLFRGAYLQASGTAKGFFKTVNFVGSTVVADPSDVSRATVTVAAAPSTAPVRAHDTSLSPVALWQLDANPVVDSIGARNLTITGAYVPVCDLAYGLKGWRFGGSNILVRDIADAAFNLTAAMSVEMILRADSASATDGTLITFSSGGVTGDGTTNCNFRLVLAAKAGSGGTGPLGIYWQQENGNGGTNSEFRSTTFSVPTGQPFHLAVTRSTASGGSQTIKIYINAVLVASSTVLTTTGGSASRLCIGQKAYNNGNFPLDNVVIASMKLFNSELSAANVLAEYNYVRGA